jgi:hypothetical protein
MRSAQPPLEHLLTSSIVSLESFELSRLNAIANLRKEFRQLVDEWIEAEIEARLSRWILERRREAEAEPQPSAPLLSEHAAQALQAGGAHELQCHAHAAAPQQTGAENSQYWQQSARKDDSSHAHRIEQLALLAESTGSPESAAAAQKEHAATPEEGAADALRWLERFVRTQGVSLHSRLNALAEQQAAGSNPSGRAQPAQSPIQARADRSIAPHPPLAARVSHASPAGPSHNDRDELVDQTRGEDAVVLRPPLRQIPLFRSRVQKAS